MVCLGDTCNDPGQNRTRPCVPQSMVLTIKVFTSDGIGAVVRVLESLRPSE